MSIIDAVSSYLRETFRYAHVYKGKYVHLAKEPKEPFFLTHRWDSLEAPAVLRMIAEKIGGFDEIYLYAEDPTLTKEEYDNYHSFVRLRQETEEKLLSVCPRLASGMMSTITKIDFANTAAFQPV